MANQTSHRWIILLVLIVSLTLAVVGFATPNWYRAVVLSSVTFTAGYFDVCVSSVCFKYLDYLQLSNYTGDYIGCIVFMVIGLVFVSFACLLVICSIGNCREDCTDGVCRTEKTRYLYVACMTAIGGICFLVSVIWFYIAVIRDGNGGGNVAGSFSFEADYSLALTAAAGAILIILSIFIFMIRLKMYDVYYEEYYDDRPKQIIDQPHGPRTQEPVFMEEPVYKYERPQYAIAIEPAYRVEESPYKYERSAIRLAPAAREPEPTYVTSAPKQYRYSYRGDNDPTYQSSRPEIKLSATRLGNSMYRERRY